MTAETAVHRGFSIVLTLYIYSHYAVVAVLYDDVVLSTITNGNCLRSMYCTIGAALVVQYVDR